MSDRLATTIAEKFQEAAPKLSNAFHADTYELLALSWTNGAYGESTATATVVETGWCSLLVVNVSGGRRLEGGIALTETTYQVEIEPPTAISTKHQIRINGARTFDIQDVYRGGEMEMFVIAAIEEPEAR